MPRWTARRAAASSAARLLHRGHLVQPASSASGRRPWGSVMMADTARLLGLTRLTTFGSTRSGARRQYCRGHWHDGLALLSLGQAGRAAARKLASRVAGGYGSGCHREISLVATLDRSARVVRLSCASFAVCIHAVAVSSGLLVPAPSKSRSLRRLQDCNTPSTRWASSVLGSRPHLAASISCRKTSLQSQPAHPPSQQISLACSSHLARSTSCESTVYSPRQTASLLRGHPFARADAICLLHAPSAFCSTACATRPARSVYTARRNRKIDICQLRSAVLRRCLASSHPPVRPRAAGVPGLAQHAFLLPAGAGCHGCLPADQRPSNNQSISTLCRRIALHPLRSLASDIISAHLGLWAIQAALTALQFMQLLRIC
jgi:hypothetical protein